MGTSKGIGIGVGITVGVIVVAFLIFEMGFTFVDVVEEFEDARLARLQANYNEETDKLQVVVILTDSNGDYTKASGDATITVKTTGDVRYTAYSNTYYFEKDDFVTWKDNSGNKVTGYMIDIRENFSGGSHDVFVDLNTKSGHWENLHDSFYSLE